MCQSIKILHISYYHLLALTLRRSIEAFTRKIEVSIILADRGLDSIVEAISIAMPDLIIVPLGFPCNDLMFVQKMREAHCQIPVIVICSRFALPDFVRLVESQVQGIVSTSATLEELEETIYAVIDNDPDVLQHQYQQAINTPHCSSEQEHLTTRELEILRLTATGLTDKEIADQLDLSVKTINNHMRSICEKLEVNNRCSAVAQALSKGIISPYTMLPPSHSFDLGNFI